MVLRSPFSRRRTLTMWPLSNIANRCPSQNRSLRTWVVRSLRMTSTSAVDLLFQLGVRRRVRAEALVGGHDLRTFAKPLLMSLDHLSGQRAVGRSLREDLVVGDELLRLVQYVLEQTVVVPDKRQHGLRQCPAVPIDRRAVISTRNSLPAGAIARGRCGRPLGRDRLEPSAGRWVSRPGRGPHGSGRSGPRSRGSPCRCGQP